MAAERLDATGWQRLAAGLAAGDADGQVAAAWQLKELVRGLFTANDIDRARDVFALIDAWISTVQAPACRRLVRTLRRWEDEILAFHTTGGITIARTEACNLGIKQIERVGRGFPTSTISGCGCSSPAAASPGTITLHVSEDDVPSWWCRARLPSATRWPRSLLASGVEAILAHHDAVVKHPPPPTISGASSWPSLHPHADGV